MKKAATAFLGFLFIVSSFLFLVPSAFAATPCPDTSPVAGTINEINRTGISAKKYDDKYFNFNQIAGTTDSLLTLLTGCSQLHAETNTVTAGTGAIAASGRLVAMFYAAPPVSAVAFLQTQIDKFNPIQPAYAQAGTIGFDALAPVQRIWSAFRNISYAGFAIIMVIMGFMIMFRAHISPQAVATVQDSIPRIVVAIILVTFSYAIAGLMIDLMFVALNVIINTFETQGLITPGGGDYVFKRSAIGVIYGSYLDVVKTVFNSVSSIINSLINIPVFDKAAGLLGGAIAGIIAGIALVFIMFRILFMLLMAYVSIILLTMIAPFFFLLQALPGNNSAKEWFKQVGANVAVFPVVAIMFIFAGILGGIQDLGAPPGGAPFGPQTVGQFPLLWGDLRIKDISQLIALGFIFMTPQAAEMIKNLLGVKGGIPAGIPPALAGAAGIVGKAAGAGGKQALEGSYLPLIGGMSRRVKEAKRQDIAQQKAEAGIYNPKYGEVIRRTGEEKTSADK